MFAPNSLTRTLPIEKKTIPHNLMCQVCLSHTHGCACTDAVHRKVVVLLTIAQAVDVPAKVLEGEYVSLGNADYINLRHQGEKVSTSERLMLIIYT